MGALHLFWLPWIYWTGTSDWCSTSLLFQLAYCCFSIGFCLIMMLSFKNLISDWSYLILSLSNIRFYLQTLAPQFSMSQSRFWHCKIIIPKSRLWHWKFWYSTLQIDIGNFNFNFYGLALLIWCWISHYNFWCRNLHFGNNIYDAKI